MDDRNWKVWGPLLLIGLWLLLLSGCAPGWSVQTPSFPLDEPPRDALQLARDHLKVFIADFYSPPNFEAVPNSVELVGSQALELDERDQRNGIKEQWCLAFRHRVDLGEDKGTANLYRMYQVSKKDSGWSIVTMRSFSEESNYLRRISDTWERCLVY